MADLLHNVPSSVEAVSQLPRKEWVNNLYQNHNYCCICWLSLLSPSRAGYEASALGSCLRELFLDKWLD